MCFNNAVSWQLRWYQNVAGRAQTQTWVVSETASFYGDLVGIAEFSSSADTQTVILQVTGADYDFYIG